MIKGAIRAGSVVGKGAVGAGKAVGKGAIGVSKYVVSFSPDIEKQVQTALKRKDVREAYKSFNGDPKEFIDLLKYYISLENSQNSRMRKLAGSLDFANKALIPNDVVADFYGYVMGIPQGYKSIGYLTRLPAYIAYDAYYLSKTGDLAGTLGNAAYELGSFVTPGSLPHLLKRYSKQADKYAIKQASGNFLKSLKDKGLEEKVDEGEDISEFEKKKQEKEADKKKGALTRRAA